MQICFIRRKFGRRLPSKFVGGSAFCILLLYYVWPKADISFHIYQVVGY
jgi:hypothetical protein